MTLNWLYGYVERWHDTWEVIGALATAAAFVVAFLALWRESVRAKRAEAEARRATEAVAARQTREAEERADAQRHAQARLVVGWTRFVVQFESAGGDLRSGQWRAEFGNYSDAPVFDASLVARDHTTGEAVARGRRSVLAPGDVLGIDTDEANEGRALRAVVTFRDLAGRRWRRFESGELSELDPAGDPVEVPHL